MVLVRDTVTADWQALRDIRLQALRDAPDAFASTYAREAAFGEAEWRQRAARDGSFIAFLPEAGPAGLAGGYQAVPGTIELVAMFVRPQARGRGVGEALIDAVIGWARGRDAAAVHLWVTETNSNARRLYECCGFTANAERQPLPSNPVLGEIGMTRPLYRPVYRPLGPGPG
jgi:GNAT superfamily N-acetyltransferase